MQTKPTLFLPLNPIQLISLNAVLVDCKHPLTLEPLYSTAGAGRAPVGFPRRNGASGINRVTIKARSTNKMANLYSEVTLSVAACLKAVATRFSVLEVLETVAVWAVSRLVLICSKT